jgi:hypothetical protein
MLAGPHPRSRALGGYAPRAGRRRSQRIANRGFVVDHQNARLRHFAMLVDDDEFPA